MAGRCDGFDYSRRNKRWRQLRERALSRDGYLCQESKRYGKRVDAEVVHHIWPAEQWPEYAYCLWNLVSLSGAAHDAMHDRATGKLTAKGESWRRRTIPPPPLGTLTAAFCNRRHPLEHTRGIFSGEEIGRKCESHARCGRAARP